MDEKDFDGLLLLHEEIWAGQELEPARGNCTGPSFNQPKESNAKACYSLHVTDLEVACKIIA